jgi:hypothetical protein
MGVVEREERDKERRRRDEEMRAEMVEGLESLPALFVSLSTIEQDVE